jgi:6,7-dimethyl-8-ribityllumazine synthase
MKQHREPITFNFETKPHVLIVEGRYYDDIADMQLQGAKAVLERAQATFETITVAGAFDIPPAIAYAVKGLDFDPVRRRYDGYVALGCILKGATNHHEIIGFESAGALQDLAQRYTLAIGNGILTCDTREQALERADPAQQNRAGEATEACLRMIQLKHQFNLSPKRRWVAR